MSAKVLITGGSGLVGTCLSGLLTQEGYEVVHLSRSPGRAAGYPSFYWNIGKGEIDKAAFGGVDYIIHLAGANLSRRWTKKRKRIILESRIAPTALLFQYVRELKVPLRAFISASAVGIYGADTGSRWIDEASPVGDDFLARVVQDWEMAADRFSELTRTVRLRTGVVLSTKGGALPSLVRPVRYFVGAPIGSGRQYMSWIHIHDLCRVFHHTISHDLAGVYNATAPGPATNAELTKWIAQALNRPLFMPNVPSFLMKLLFGEMSQVILGGNRVSNDRLLKTGFEFSFRSAESAIKDLLMKAKSR